MKLIINLKSIGDYLVYMFDYLVSRQPFIKTHRPHFVTQSSKKFFQDNHNTNRRAG